MMGYHIEASRFGFKELPDRILVREDGWLGAYKFDGEPIVDYWYVPEQRVEELKQENAKLRELAKHLRECTRHNTCAVCEYADDACNFDYDMRELGIEVPDA